MSKLIPKSAVLKHSLWTLGLNRERQILNFYALPALFSYMFFKYVQKKKRWQRVEVQKNIRAK